MAVARDDGGCFTAALAAPLGEVGVFSGPGSYLKSPE